MRGAYPHGSGVPRALRGPHGGDLPRGAHPRRNAEPGRGAGGRPRLGGARPAPARAGLSRRAPQDRHPAPPGRPERRFRRLRGAARRPSRPGVFLPRRCGAASPAGLVPHRPYQSPHPCPHSRCPRSLSALHGGDRGRGPALLSLHRGQGGAFRGPRFPPDLRRAGGARHLGALPERHFHQPALRRAACAGALDSRLRAGAHHPAGLRHRVRLLRSAGAAFHPGDEGGARALPGRADQRHHRLRGGRRARSRRGVQRGGPRAGEGAVEPAARRGLYRRADRRPRHPRHRRALPHVHQPCRVSPAAARGQRGPAPLRRRAPARSRRGRAMARLRGEARSDRARAGAARGDPGARR